MLLDPEDISCWTYEFPAAWGFAWSFAIWDELLYLESKQVDIPVFTETHWKNENEFQMSHTNSQEVLILVSKIRFGKAALIQFNHEKPGRLLHVRISQGDFVLDVLGTYQAVWALKPHETCEKLLHGRLQVWKALRDALCKIPKRHKLLVVGDFSCSFAPFTSLVGAGALPELQNARQDSHKLIGTLQTFGEN